MGRSSQWGVGDWVRYGNTRFGERYARAARITGYDPQTLRNMVYVSSRFEVSRRRDDLSWSHHESVASLEQQEQEQWLDLAAEHSLSIADLRSAVRAWRRKAGESAESNTTGGGRRGRTLVCPNCGTRIVDIAEAGPAEKQAVKNEQR